MNRIKEVLNEQGRSQRWLADQIGKSVAMVNFYCRNKNQPTMDVFCRIANVLEVSLNDLWISEKQQ